MEQQDLLQDLEQEIYLERASHGARFVNYLIDVVFFYALVFIGGIIYAIVAVPTTISSGESASYGRDKASGTLEIYLVAYLAYVGVYTIFEGATKGRTLGKLITGTRAMQINGAPITWKDALIRSLIRIVPFEPLSGFGTPWHDKWSNTQVVKVKR